MRQIVFLPPNLNSMLLVVFFTPNLNSMLLVLNGGDYVFIAPVKNLT